MLKTKKEFIIMQINPRKVLEERMLIPVEGSDPFNKESNYGTRIAQNGVDCTLKEELVLQPKSFKNVQIGERFRVPNNVIAWPFPRSSYSRKGVFISSGLYDSGFGIDREEGAAGGVSIYNFSDEVVVIPKGERVLQFIFCTGEAHELYTGHYGKTDDISSKIK